MPCGAVPCFPAIIAYKETKGNYSAGLCIQTLLNCYYDLKRIPHPQFEGYEGRNVCDDRILTKSYYGVTLMMGKTKNHITKTAEE